MGERDAITNDIDDNDIVAVDHHGVSETISALTSPRFLLLSRVL